MTQHQVRAITTAELSRFLQAIDGKQFRNIFFIDIFSGLRLSEILGLRWEDVDFDHDCIYVRQQLQQKQVKGDFGYFLAPPKEGKQRKVILAQNAMRVLRHQRAKQNEQQLAAGILWDNSFHLVFTNDFGQPLNRRTVYKHLKRILLDCGMGNYTFHSLRHSFATISHHNRGAVRFGRCPSRMAAFVTEAGETFVAEEAATSRSMNTAPVLARQRKRSGNMIRRFIKGVLR